MTTTAAEPDAAVTACFGSFAADHGEESEGTDDEGQAREARVHWVSLSRSIRDRTLESVGRFSVHPLGQLSHCPIAHETSGFIGTYTCIGDLLKLPGVTGSSRLPGLWWRGDTQIGSQPRHSTGILDTRDGRSLKSHLPNGGPA